MSQISPKTPLYIGGRGRASLEGQPIKGALAAREEEDSSSNSIWEGGVLPFLPTSLFPFFFYFPLVFSYVAPWAPWADSTRPLRTCGSTLVHWAQSRVGGPLPVNSRNPFVTPGTLPELPKTFRRPNETILYINLHFQTIPETLMTSVISSETPNNIR